MFYYFLYYFVEESNDLWTKANFKVEIPGRSWSFLVVPGRSWSLISMFQNIISNGTYADCSMAVALYKSETIT